MKIKDNKNTASAEKQMTLTVKKPNSPKMTDDIKQTVPINANGLFISYTSFSLRFGPLKM